MNEKELEDLLYIYSAKVIRGAVYGIACFLLLLANPHFEGSYFAFSSAIFLTAMYDRAVTAANIALALMAGMALISPQLLEALT